jgi:superfamily II DNA or RNA helicase
MPFQRKTVREFCDIFCEYDKELFEVVWRRRWNYLEDRPIRQVAELFSLMRRVVNSDPSRVNRLRDILITSPRVIVFYNFDYELEDLRKMLETSGYQYAEWNGHKHEDIPDGEEWVYLVQYMAGAEGWNCVTTDTMVFYSMTYSYRQFVQAQGRIDRLNTPFTTLYYYVFKSASVIDLSISKAIHHKRSFNERTALKYLAGL